MLVHPGSCGALAYRINTAITKAIVRVGKPTSCMLGINQSRRIEEAKLSNHPRCHTSITQRTWWFRKGSRRLLQLHAHTYVVLGGRGQFCACSYKYSVGCKNLPKYSPSRSAIAQGPCGTSQGRRCYGVALPMSSCASRLFQLSRSRSRTRSSKALILSPFLALAASCNSNVLWN
jgi:hypothetical protein